MARNLWHASLIISQTGIGTAAAGAATALACALYQPSLIVNQGTAGGYGDLAVGDVVLASALYNATPAIWGVMACVSWSLAALNTSPWLPWTSPMCRRFLRRMKGSDIYWRLFSKKAALPTARASSPQVINGTRPSEQIRRIREKTGALCEEMEAAAVWMTAKRFRVSCAFVRIISNNNERGLSFDPSVCETFISLIEEFPHVINGYLIDSLFPSNRERLFYYVGGPMR